MLEHFVTGNDAWGKMSQSKATQRKRAVGEGLHQTQTLLKAVERTDTVKTLPIKYNKCVENYYQESD